MRYIKAAEILPKEIIEIIQTYVDGETIYIPRKDGERKLWGENTSTRREIARRNREIFRQYQSGIPTAILAERFFLSPKSIQKIIAKLK